MVPCPWFPEIAEIARRRPDLDLGVHLTLNAEFADYRWRPLTGVSDNGLTDADGYMWRDVASARQADLAAVEAEMRAQIDTALAAGIDVTHLDSHMGTVAMPEYLDIYARLGAEYRLPIFLIRDVVGFAASSNHSPEIAGRYAGAFDELVARGNPAFQAFVTSPWGNKGDVEVAYRRILSAAASGLNWGAFHFDMPGAIEAYSQDAKMRIAEYEFFRSGGAKALFDELGIELIGMRRFRDAMRGT
jgi:chitin disaccharide deacetylase